jgi:16S rRNA (cytosine1402-N4)-methyltransferase
MKSEFRHFPVMLAEAVEYMKVDPGGIYCDLTLGGGSHSEQIAKRLDKGKLISVDRDADALDHSRERLREYRDKIYFVKDNYINIKEIVKNAGFEKINGALIDLGISTYQIEADRGFSYVKDSALDMRMDRDQKLTAADVVNNLDENKLREIFYAYSDEKNSRIIAREIVKKRENKPITTTLELAEIIKYAVRNIRYTGGHPAKRVFQAIRIFVNGEIEAIQPTLDSVEGILESKGRLAVISFHSGEDKIVKRCFAEYEKNCVCPHDFPVCACGKRATSKILTKKPVYPGREEIEKNPPSESAKLRVLEKL